MKSNQNIPKPIHKHTFNFGLEKIVSKQLPIVLQSELAEIVNLHFVNRKMSTTCPACPRPPASGNHRRRLQRVELRNRPCRPGKVRILSAAPFRLR